MAMTSCHECGNSISSTANSCPTCGAKVPRTKWWLWVPLGLIVMFFAYGLTIPEYQSQARQKREACEALVGPLRKDECRRMYDNDVAAGKAGSGGPTKGYEAPVDRALAEATAKARTTEDAAQLKDCQKNVAAKKAEYQRLMGKAEYWSASLALRRCSELQDDPALKALVAEAERKQYISEIESPTATRDVRNQAIEALLRDYPETGKKYAKLLKK